MKNKNMLLGLVLIISSVIFCTAETHYFGDNLLPKSIAECTCDCVSLLGSSFGYFFIF